MLVRGKLLAAGFDPDTMPFRDWLDFVFAFALEPPGGFVNPYEFREDMIALFMEGSIPERKEDPVKGVPTKKAKTKSRPSDVRRAVSDLEEMRRRQAERKASQDKTGAG